MPTAHVPELLAPAGSLDAVRAAIANGADAVYLGAVRFNARDDGAQLTLDELDEACRLAHGRGRRVYLTLNVLVKPAELVDALELLGEAIDRGIDAAIVQDLGLVRLIRRIYPSLEVHGSTQMTVHDASGARVVRGLGISRAVLARENTLDDIRSIKAAVPELGLESFVHGALCISYSGQCYMSGMISERSANRGSCAQSCRKDYVLADHAGGELDRGYLISARDLAAFDHLGDLAAAGVECLKVEGRKKRPEYVATVSRTYRAALDRLSRGEAAALAPEEVQPLVQIYSRGFTSGMLAGRVGREYVTRDQPDNRGVPLGVVSGGRQGELTIEVSEPVQVGDGIGFEHPESTGGPTVGFTVTRVRTEGGRDGAKPARGVRQIIAAPRPVPVGWRVVRTAHAALIARARESYAAVVPSAGQRRSRIDVRVFGSAGAHLRALFTAEGRTATVRSETQLVPAATRALTDTVLRDQFGRLGDTPYALASLDTAGLAPGLFLRVSDLNRMRQGAVAELLEARQAKGEVTQAHRRERIRRAVADVDPVPASPKARAFDLTAEVFAIDDARRAADAGATEICIDPFLRHPAPPVARVRALAEELARRHVTLRLRTPTIVRSDERPSVERWLDTGLPVLSGHLGLVAELAAAGRDVVADYAVNCFNQHSAAEVLRLGARRVTLSVELTADELIQLAEPFSGRRFELFVYGRPEGMTIEHCVLSAAFDREPTTCRDLCVRDHTNVELTDPAGYVFPVATDSACRNRLLHSRPVDGSEFLPRLWRAGFRSFRAVFNVPADPVVPVVAALRHTLDALARGAGVDPAAARSAIGPHFTRGHFARAV